MLDATRGQSITRLSRLEHRCRRLKRSECGCSVLSEDARLSGGVGYRFVPPSPLFYLLLRLPVS